MVGARKHYRSSNRAVLINPLPDDLADAMRRQMLLAEIAESEEVRAMHVALEQLYKSQLVAMELAGRLAMIHSPSAIP